MDKSQAEVFNHHQKSLQSFFVWIKAQLFSPDNVKLWKFGKFLKMCWKDFKSSVGWDMQLKSGSTSSLLVKTLWMKMFSNVMKGVQKQERKWGSYEITNNFNFLWL